ncbi:hypothetical protein FGG08_002862, partial [Glutinoglossum americanum]
LCSKEDAVNTRRKASLATVMYTDPEVLDCFLGLPNARHEARKALIDALDLGNNELRDEIRSLGDHEHFGRFTVDGDTGFESLNMAELVDVLQTRAPLMLQLLQGTTKSIYQQRERQNDFGPRFVLILAILCFSQRRNSASNFQTILGLYLHSKGVKRRQLDLLTQLGVTVSYQSIMRSIKLLSEKAAESVAETGCQSSDAVTAYDNFEQVEGVKEQRVGENDRLHSVTTGEVIRGIDIPPGGLRQDMLNPQAELRTGDIFFAPGNSQDTIEHQISRYFTVQAIRMAFPEATRSIFTSTASTNSISIMPAIDILKPRKTVHYPLGLIPYDESSNSGNLAVLENIFRKQYGLSCNLSSNFRGYKQFAIIGLRP